MEFNDNVKKRLWNTCCARFPILELEQEPYENVDVYTENVNDLLLETGFIPEIYNATFDLIKKSIPGHTDLWDSLLVKDEWTTLEAVKHNLQKLDSVVMAFRPLLNELEALRLLHMDVNKTTLYPEDNMENCFSALMSIVRTKIWADMGANYGHIYSNLHLASYRAYMASHNQMDADMVMKSRFNFCTYCNHPATNCKCKTYIEDVGFVFRFLSSFNILGCMMEEFKETMRQQIDHYVPKIVDQNCCTGSLDHVLDWFKKMWDTYVVYLSSHFHYQFIAYESELRHYVIRCYLFASTSHIFQLILAYPKSSQAVEDMRRALKVIHFHGNIYIHLDSIIKANLLVARVSTWNILKTFTLTYRALQHLDPTGRLVKHSIEPVKTYLKTRNDVIRSIISNFILNGAVFNVEMPPPNRTESPPNDDIFKKDEQQRFDELLNDVQEQRRINDLLKKVQQLINIPSTSGRKYEEMRKSMFPAKPKQNNRQVVDVLTIFVEVLANKQVFIDEYQRLLADRSLTDLSFNVEKEQRCLELLKKRFGEEDLMKCQSMLNDITDFLKLSSSVRDDEEFNFMKRSFLKNSYIMSRKVWPQFKDMSLKLPNKLQKHPDGYHNEYEKYANNLKIVWKPDSGTVKLNIFCEERMISATVTPIHATILYRFQNQKEWNIHDLECVTGIASEILREKISYWIHLGIICGKRDNVFELVGESRPPRTFLNQPKPKLSMIKECDENDEVSKKPAVAEEIEVLDLAALGLNDD